MDRIRSQDTAERIGIARSLIPERLWWWIGGTDFFEGDPAFAGAHRFGHVRDRDTGERMYQGNVAHYFDIRNVRSWQLRSRAVPTVALPERYCGGRNGYPSVKTIVHELGHALYYRLTGHSVGRPRERLTVNWHRGDREVLTWKGVGCFPSLAHPLTNYCEDDFVEQFAEAFAIWVHPTLHIGGDGPLAALGFYELPTWFPAWDARGMWDVGGDRRDNRRLLAFFNELAGWPGDLPPRALR